MDISSNFEDDHHHYVLCGVSDYNCMAGLISTFNGDVTQVMNSQNKLYHNNITPFRHLRGNREVYIQVSSLRNGFHRLQYGLWPTFIRPCFISNFYQHIKAFKPADGTFPKRCEPDTIWGNMDGMGCRQEDSL